MRKIIYFAVFCLLAVMLVGCAPKPDVFTPFQGAYFAEVSGELYGMPFSARVEMASETGEGVREATVIFYAPEMLAGTTVQRNGTGEITVSSGGLSLSDAGGIGAALLSLFPVAGEITETALTEDGHTRICGEGFTLILLSDGTPAQIETDAVSATVVRWEPR